MKYGGRFPAVPCLSRITQELRILWYLISVLVMLPDMWAMAVDALSMDQQWMGWILSFATNHCYATKTCFATKNNPYAVLKPEEIFEKLGALHGFCVTNLVSLFTEIPGLCIITAHQLQTHEYAVQLDINIVMVIWMRLVGQVLFDDVLNVGGGSRDEWQLRFVGMTFDVSQEAPHKWKGRLYARHGGDELIGWWVQDQEWKLCWPVEGDLPEIVYGHWDVLVYCRKYDPDMDALRDAYLEYLGGQTKVFCGLHRTPMIPGVKICWLCKTCCVLEENRNQCTMKGYLCCAFDNCCAAVCMHHSDSVMEDGRTLYIYPVVDGSVVDGGAVIMASDAEVLDSDDEEVVEVGNYDEQMFVTDNFVEDNEFFFDLSEQDDCSNLGEFLTTNAGCTAYDLVAGSGSVPGHVILNNCGSCLIQQNHQLKGTKYQQAFLQQIVSTSKGHAVPLVYPEAMLMPSIFWRDTADGSLVGALPAAVMASKAECKVFGIASMQEHIQSQLTNPSLRCSTDPHYIFYAYDCVANINLRGEDTRIILNHGFVESQGKGGLKVNCSGEFNTDAVDSHLVVNRLAAAMGEKNFTYFFTQMVNQSGFFGIKPMKEWIDSEEFKSLLLQGRDMRKKRSYGELGKRVAVFH